MTPIANLHILAEKFQQLSNAVYFDAAFQEFAQRTAKATLHAIENSGYYPPQTLRGLQDQLWRVLQFISGSRSNDAPHEVQYVLKTVLKEWGMEGALVSSASLNELNFFLDPLHLWEFIERSLDKFDAEQYSKAVVRIASPEAFKNKPIFCIPLFHELGHYIDFDLKISELSLILHPPPPAPQGIQKQHWMMIQLNHRMEYFADLFAACYCGTTISKSLLAIAPHNAENHTHPATIDRVQVVDAFLAGNKNNIIEIIQNTLAARGFLPLQVKYRVPDIKDAFDDVLTYAIKDEAELYGIFSASWNYFDEQTRNRSAPWINEQVDGSVIERTINDLTEKSLRNYEIRERWKFGVANQV